MVSPEYLNEIADEIVNLTMLFGPINATVDY
jgi:hypothetical protein